MIRLDLNAIKIPVYFQMSIDRSKNLYSYRFVIGMKTDRFFLNWDKDISFSLVVEYYFYRIVWKFLCSRNGWEFESLNIHRFEW